MVTIAPAGAVTVMVETATPSIPNSSSIASCTVVETKGVPILLKGRLSATNSTSPLLPLTDKTTSPLSSSFISCLSSVVQ